MRVALGWQLSSYFGWGVYALNLALEWARDPALEASSRFPIDERSIVLDPLRRHVLEPFLQRSFRGLGPGVIVIDALGNEAEGRTGSRIAAIFFERPLSAGAIARLKRYDLVIAGSSWNAAVLAGHGLRNVVTILQGVDHTLFHPAPKRGLFPGKFLIFSGGKAEPRKGQDLVVKAFRAFAQRHPDAMLVTAWHSPWPQLAGGMDLDLSDLADRVIDVGQVPNGLMAPVYRECDVALFPNRAEGGTNLVAMEAIACGVPTIVSANTGHLDLCGRGGVWPLERQLLSADGRGESDVAEIVEALELARRMPWQPRAHNPIPDLTWSATADALTGAIRSLTQEDQHGKGNGLAAE